ncbi:MAG TPA: glycosyl hydrolase-related protein [Terriglobia bacterium]|nr:glycosyl hydrolase-related protein [Terriglobia bacterium]
MDRRNFLRNSGMLAGAWALEKGFDPWGSPRRLVAADSGESESNPNLADVKLGATATASSNSETPPWGYMPGNVMNEILQTSWETDRETAGAWLEIQFPQEQNVAELWVLPKALPYDLVLDPYMRGGRMATARRVTFSVPGGASQAAELRNVRYFQIIRLSSAQKAKSVRITVNDTWPEANTEGTGLGKVRVFARPHSAAFEVRAYAMYDVREGKAVQSATVELINPGSEVTGAQLEVTHDGKVLTAVPLETIPAQAVVRQNIWIPAPFEDQVMEFRVVDPSSIFKVSRKLNVPAYHSYFDGGTFNFLTTNHNDLGWLDTQYVTADYRSAEIILPAIELLNKYPDFRYSMESVIYLMEFLARHPEKREEIGRLTREGRFTWGASYVQNLEVRVGPENLIRQFYLGRRWLKKNFPGSDSRHYFKADPPGMTYQMPQILTKAGIKYVIQGRFPWGFYNWEGLDGSRIFVFAFRYGDPRTLPNPKGNQGWLSYATAREYYYEPRQLPKIMIYDFNGDYLPPPASLIPYVHEQNEAMKRFAAKWNEHYAGNPDRHIKPPIIRFVEPEGVLAELTSHELNIETVKGDWPINWAYYDEPGHRDGLLAGREGHNRLLIAERLSAALGASDGFASYPQKAIEDAWKVNCWPDHGWGGNKGTETDAIGVQAYIKSREMADKLLSDAGSRLARSVRKGAAGQLPLVVFNPLSWQRTDVVRCRFEKPSGWSSFRLRDEAGKEVSCQLVGDVSSGRDAKFAFVADAVPSVGYRTYYLESSSTPPPSGDPFTGDTMENDDLRAVFGAGGLKSLYDKRLEREFLKTEKFFGGEVLQFTAPGMAWDSAPADVADVLMDDFDKTSNHDFPIRRLIKGPVVISALREAQFKNFRLRQGFHLYPRLDRIEMDVHLIDWDGTSKRELLVAFPINLTGTVRCSYEVPFGTVEMGKDEIDFTLLPPSIDCQFIRGIYGGDVALPFREAINWIDASSDRFQQYGCLAASDCTVHRFKDVSSDPVSYPVLQHALLSTRKSHAWNPAYWFTQEGSHHYRMALLPHPGGWRTRYREGISFNYPLLAFVAPSATSGGGSLPQSQAFMRLEPANLIMTAMKKCEDDGSIALRFYEAEGRAVRAHICLFRPIKQAWKTNLIEEEPEPLPIASGGALELNVMPWEIVTVKLAV